MGVIGWNVMGLIAGFITSNLVTTGSMTQLLGSCGEGKWLALFGGLAIIGLITGSLTRTSTTT